MKLFMNILQLEVMPPSNFKFHTINNTNTAVVETSEVGKMLIICRKTVKYCIVFVRTVFYRM
jgi:hypothetical protein